jgi:hypothetical protein
MDLTLAVQTPTFITIHCGSYIRKLLSNHGWDDMKPTHLPMPADNEYIRTLDTATAPTNEAPCHALVEQVHFQYHGAIGELIRAMITCCPDLSFPVVKLSQFPTSPSALHYTAVKRVFRYLSGTIDHGLT